MKRKIVVNLIIAFLIVISSFTVVNATRTCEAAEDTSPPKGDIVFTKTVLDGENWVDEIDAEVGETVRFNITLTYYKHPENPNDWSLYKIKINDVLPECLVFADNVNFINAPAIEEDIAENVIYWNFSNYDPRLDDEESMSIEFDATVVESEELENENRATVTAVECSEYDHFGEDSAWVYIEEPGQWIEVEKKVWDPEAGDWVEELDEVRRDENVRFQIRISYFGEGLMKCMIVEDFLPEECLEYAGNEEFIYPNDEFFEDPEIFVSGDLKYVEWNWGSDILFNLYDRESVVIRFDAKVTEYCYCPVTNCAYVELCSCYWCPYFYDWDCATVNCVPPDSKFEKKVQEGNNWVEETGTYVGDTVTFKLSLNYYGNDFLHTIKLVDHLPCCLEYIDNAFLSGPYKEGDMVVPITQLEGDVSEDGKTIWFNLTQELEDGEMLFVEFDALVTGATTGDCQECDGINTATLTAKEGCSGMYGPYEDTAVIMSTHRPCPPIIHGDENGEADEELTFYIRSSDPDGDEICYCIDWGEGIEGLEWIGPFESGEEIEVTHTWSSEGTYDVRVKATDIYDIESEWGNTLSVDITSSHGHGLRIKLKKISIGCVRAKIKYFGEENLSDLEWNMSVKGGVFNRINVAANGVIETLESGSCASISTPYRSMLRRIGLVKITLEVNIPGEGTLEETFYGLVIGRVFIDMTFRAY